MNSDGASSSFTNFFVAVQLAGAILLAILVGTVLLSRRVERNVTWINLCIAWIVSAFSYTMLAPFGYQSGPQPPASVCFAQSMLIYGAPILTTLSGLALSIQLHLDCESTVSGIRATSLVRNVILCIGPLTCYLLVMIGAMIYGRGRSISRTNIDTYCHFTTSSLGDLVAVVSVITLVLNACLLGYVVVRLARYSKMAKHIEAIRPLRRGILRILILQLILFFPIITSIIFLGDEMYRYLFDFMISSMPIIAFVVLGIQPDVLRVWFWWHRPIGCDLGDPVPLDVESPILPAKHSMSDADY